MALTAYQQNALLLLNDAGIATFNPDDLTTYVNLGRSQIASEGECIRDIGTLDMNLEKNAWSFSSIALPSGLGYQSVLTLRQVSYTPSGTKKAYMAQRNWEWFFRYYLSAGVDLPVGVPTIWSVLGRGTAGTLYVYPTPNAPDILNMDCVILPINLAYDTDIEALPYPFTDAVPFYAAYYAASSIGNKDAAKQYFDLYKYYVKVASEGSTPTVLPQNYPGFGGAQLARQAVPLDGGEQQGQS